MLQFFRKILGSKFGIIGALAFLVLIALAFAGGDIANMRGGKGGAGNAVATIGNRKIDAASVSQAANATLQKIKEEQPTMSMQNLLAAGGLDRVVDNLIDRAALSEWGDKHGIVASDRLADSEIAKLPAFQGPDGKFSQTLFRQMMQQRGVSEKLVREDISDGLVARELLVPASFGAVMPRSLARQYAELLKERRQGTIAVVPAELFAPAQQPDDRTLAAWYQAHRTRFIRPERRVIRYAVLGDADLKTVTPPTDAEIAARYRANAAQYASVQTRTITQLILPSQADAEAVIADVAKGKSLAAVGQARGLVVSTKGPLTRNALAEQTSPAVADTAFAGAQGVIVGPARSGLGWHVARVDAATVTPVRTLDQVRGEIGQQLLAEKRRKALADVTTGIESTFDDGGGLADAAKRLGLAVQQTGPLTADGGVYGEVGKTASPELARVLKTAFAMEQEHKPQLGEVEPGKRFVMFEVAEIAPSAPAPLAEIKADVSADYVLDRGFAASGEAARKVLQETRKSGDVTKALASLGRPLPPLQPITMSRDELTQMQQQSRRPIPAPLVLLFSMAQGTTKLLPAPGNRGWFIVTLKQITPGVVAETDPLIAGAQRELGNVSGEEYAGALRRAIRAELGAKTNPAAIAAVRRELGGGGGGGTAEQ